MLADRVTRRGGLAGLRERRRRLLFSEGDLDLGWLRDQERALEIWCEEETRAPDPDLALVDRLDHHRRWLSQKIRRLTEELRDPDLRPGPRQT